jgi:hypothetical protein
MRCASALLAAALLCALTLADDAAGVTTPQERGHVIVHKRVQESVLVQNQPFTVVYDVLNIGTECVPMCVCVCVCVCVWRQASALWRRPCGPPPRLCCPSTRAQPSLTRTPNPTHTHAPPFPHHTPFASALPTMWR